jgi:hypothetical protein
MGCTHCQEYHEQISKVTGALASWERNFEEVEPSSAAVARWVRDVTGARELELPIREERFHWLFDWCKDMFWPTRRLWAGLAAAWLVILGANLFERDPAQRERAVSSRPSLEMVRAYLKHEGFLGEPGRRGQKQVTAPPAFPAPAPRGEHRRGSSAA